MEDVKPTIDLEKEKILKRSATLNELEKKREEEDYQYSDSEIFS